MAPVIPSPPAIHLPPTLDSTFLTHADELRRRLADERTSIDTVISAARDIEAQATMAIHKRQAGDESGALADASDAALALWSLRRSGVAESVAHRSAVAHAATAVATLQILETFLQTGTLGARPHGILLTGRHECPSRSRMARVPTRAFVVAAVPLWWRPRHHGAALR